MEADTWTGDVLKLGTVLRKRTQRIQMKEMQNQVIRKNPPEAREQERGGPF